MILFPAVDLYSGNVVRLTRGDYSQMTFYSSDPLAVALGFRESGAEYLHAVDLEGARDGSTPNFDDIAKLAAQSGLKVEAGGGIRTRAVAERYLSAGVFRVILGTAAASDSALLRELVRDFGDSIAVGVDVRDGRVAVRGWTELTELSARDFCRDLREIGVTTIICTDISRDGLLAGANLAMYRDMQSELGVDIVASGGITSLDDVKALRDMGLHGAVLGRALYTGALNFAEAVKLCASEDDA